MLLNNTGYVGDEEEWMDVGGDCQGAGVKTSNRLVDGIFGVDVDILFERDHSIFVCSEWNGLVLSEHAGYRGFEDTHEPQRTAVYLVDGRCHCYFAGPEVCEVCHRTEE